MVASSEKSIGRLFYPSRRPPSAGFLRRVSGRAPAPRGPSRAGSPPPRRTIDRRLDREIDDRRRLGGHAPASMTRSSSRLQRARGSSPASFSGSSAPGRISVDDRIGSPSSGQQRLHDRVIRHAHADRAALRVLQPPRHFARRRQQEREAPGRALADDPELPVVELREMADLGQVAQHERQVVRVVDAADLADPLRRRRVAEVAAERVARIGRVGDHAAVAQDRRRLPDEPRLRIGGVNVEELAMTRPRRPDLRYNARPRRATARRGCIRLRRSAKRRRHSNALPAPGVP